MRTLSFNARSALDGGISSADEEIALVRFTSPSGATSVRVSSGATERLSIIPPIYGVRSSWLTPDPDTDPFIRLLTAAQLPDDKDEGQGEVRLILDNSGPEIVTLLRSFTERAIVDLAVVLASTPDHVEFEQQGMRLIGAEGNSSQITLTITADPVGEESWPAPRMTRQRFPGLFA